MSNLFNFENNTKTVTFNTQADLQVMSRTTMSTCRFGPLQRPSVSVEKHDEFIPSPSLSPFAHQRFNENFDGYSPMIDPQMF